MSGNIENEDQILDHNGVWNPLFKADQHIWQDYKSSSNGCTFEGCNGQGPRKKCSSCQAKVHVTCLNSFNEACRRTFGDEKVLHHLVRRETKKNCAVCQKNLKREKSYQCSWCKQFFHQNCGLEAECNFGDQRSIILPPSWISLVDRKFVINQKSDDITPIIALVNPKSGGNKGSIVIKRLQFILNPRQVFDVSTPTHFIADLFKNVSNIRYLICGGDGSAGFAMHSFNIEKHNRPIAILPLGTGNDLSRTLGWGPGYMKEDLDKILTEVSKGNISLLDRWFIEAENDCRLPMTEFNNYLSVGVDAYVANEFHLARNTNPEKFKSQFFNKVYYATTGGVEIIRQTYKDLKDYIELIIDGQNLKAELERYSPEAILFLNIPNYSAGTSPWGTGTDVARQSFSDKKIEIIFLTSVQLAKLHLNEHATRIQQCNEAKIILHKNLPMQVDGEPFYSNTNIITVRHGYQSQVIVREDSKISLRLLMFEMEDTKNFSKENHKDKYKNLGYLTCEQGLTLADLRSFIESKTLFSQRLDSKWYFLDGKNIVQSVNEKSMRFEKIMVKSHVIILLKTQKEACQNNNIIINNNNNANWRIRNKPKLKNNSFSRSDGYINEMAKNSLAENNSEIASNDDPVLLESSENLQCPVCIDSLSSDGDDDMNSSKEELSNNINEKSYYAFKARQGAIRRKEIKIKTMSDEEKEIKDTVKNDPENHAVIIPNLLFNKRITKPLIDCDSQKVKIKTISDEEKEIKETVKNDPENHAVIIPNVIFNKRITKTGSESDGQKKPPVIPRTMKADIRRSSVN